MTWQEVAALLGSLAALLVSLSAWKKGKAESNKIDIESDVSLSSLYRSVLEDVGKLKTSLRDADKVHGLLEERLLQSEEHEKECKHRLARLEGILPFSLLSDRLDELSSISDILDRCSDGIVITSPSNEGTFIWANLSFCLSLGMTRDELLQVNWKSLVHPDDVERTQNVEMQAWISPVEGFVNRLIGKSGRTTIYKWFSTQYKKGISISIVKINPSLIIVSGKQETV